ncbi:hypothetical protein [Xanthobacter sp. VNH20]|uniref:hypothetical protein n=1 Tax=Xanthobacter sp. VNH20 TaxID=3156616 RepID=UPI0032B4034B
MAERRSARNKLTNDSAALNATNPSTTASLQVIGEDPDLFVITTGAIAALAAVAQIVGVAHQIFAGHTFRAPEGARNFAHSLEDEIHNFIRELEDLERFLRDKTTSSGDSALEAPNEFGAAKMLLMKRDFDTLRSKVDTISHKIHFINGATTSIIAFDSEFSAQIGAEILRSLGDINGRINNLRTKSFGDAYSEIISMLREIERVLIRLRNSN